MQFTPIYSTIHVTIWREKNEKCVSIRDEKTLQIDFVLHNF